MCDRIANQFFTDCEQDGRQPNEDNLQSWLWFTCPAQFRDEVGYKIINDDRYAGANSVIMK